MRQVAITFLFSLFIISSISAQYNQGNIQEVITFNFDDINKQFHPSTKYDYRYDANETDRITAYTVSKFDKEQGEWVNYKLAEKQINEYDHLTYAAWAYYKNDAWSYLTKRSYNLEHDAKGNVSSASMDDYSDTSNKNVKNSELFNNSHLFREYDDFQVVYSPDHIITHAEQTVFDDNDRLISGIYGKCNIYEYRYQYDAAGKVVSFEKYQEDEILGWVLKEKGDFIYNQVKTNTRSAITNIKAYPNPVNDFVHVVLDGDQKEDQQLILSNYYGQTIKVLDLNFNQNEVIIDISEETAGMYFLNIKNGPDSEAVKIIKAR